MRLPAAVNLLPFILALSAPSGAKIRAASMDLVAKAGVEPSMASLLSDALRSEIYDSGAFELMNREDMDSILKEIRYQNSGACDSTSCVVEMGQALGVEKMISGSVGKFGATFAVNLKMVDIKLAKNDVLFTEYHKGKEDDLPDFIRTIAKRLLKEANAAAAAEAAPATKPETSAPSAKVLPSPSKAASGSQTQTPAASPLAKAGASRTPEPHAKVLAEAPRAKAVPSKISSPRPRRKPLVAGLIGLVPGAGQAYNGQNVKAIVAGALGLGGVIGMVVTKSSAEKARDAYGAAMAGEDFEALVSDFNSKRGTNQAMLGVTLGVCVLSSVDSIISAGRNKGKGPSVSLNPDGGEISYAFDF